MLLFLYKKVSSFSISKNFLLLTFYTFTLNFMLNCYCFHYNSLIYYTGNIFQVFFDKIIGIFSLTELAQSADQMLWRRV